MGGFRRWLQDTTIHGALIQALLPMLVIGVLVYLGYGYLVGQGGRDAPSATTAPKPPASTQTPEQSLGPGPPPLVADRSLKRGEEGRTDLRKFFALRELVPEENDLRIGNSPRGVYGFAKMAEVLERREFRLRRGRMDPITEVEVHKLRDNSLRLLGFVSREVALQLDADARKSPRVTLYNGAWPNADYLVSLQIAEVKGVRDIRYISYDGGLTFALDLELDVLSTRQSEGTRQ